MPPWKNVQQVITILCTSEKRNATRRDARLWANKNSVVLFIRISTFDPIKPELKDVMSVLLGIKKDQKETKARVNSKLKDISSKVSESNQKSDQALAVAQEALKQVNMLKAGPGSGASTASVGSSANLTANNNNASKQSTLNDRKMILGGFDDYSGEDEMRPYVDIVFQEWTQQTQTSWCANPGNHATVSLKKMTLVGSFSRVGKRFRKSRHPMIIEYRSSQMDFLRFGCGAKSIRINPRETKQQRL